MEIQLQYPATPEYAAQHAELIVEPAKNISNVELDFSPGSLAYLDEIIEGFQNEGIAAEEIAATLFCFGCYVGEVILRNHGGIWMDAKDTPMNEFALFPIVLQIGKHSFCNPIGKVFKRFETGEEDSLVQFYEIFTKKKE